MVTQGAGQGGGGGPPLIGTLGPYHHFEGEYKDNPHEVTYNLYDQGQGTVGIEIITKSTDPSKLGKLPLVAAAKAINAAASSPAGTYQAGTIAFSKPSLYEAEKWIKEQAAFDSNKIKPQIVAERYEALAKALGSASQIDFEKGATEETQAFMDELKEKKLLEAAKIEAVLTGFGNQCFYMENIEPFVLYARGGTQKITEEQRGEMLAKLENAKQSDQQLQAQKDHINKLAQGNDAAGSREHGYGSDIVKNHMKLLSSARPELVINALLSDTMSNLRDFQKGTSAMYSALVPQVKLFKVFRENGDEIPIPFSTHLGEGRSGQGVTEMLESREGRADDVGILSFDFEFEKAEVAMATDVKTVNANLKLLFESVDSFTKERSLSSSKGALRTFRFSDLVIEGGKTPGGDESKSADEYNIRIVLGYDVPSTAAETIPGSAAFFKAAKRVETSMILHTKMYDLEFTESGQMIMNFDYSANIEERLQYPEFNVFGTELGILKKKMEAAQQKLRDAKKEFKTLGGTAKVQKGQTVDPTSAAGHAGANIRSLEDQIQQIERRRTGAMNSAYDDFKNSVLDKVHEFSTSRGSILSYLFLRNLPDVIPEGDKKALELYNLWSTETDVSVTKMRPAAWTSEYELIAAGMHGAALPQDDPTIPDVKMHWVYFGDIVAAALEQKHISEQLKEHNIDFLMGQIILSSYVSYRQGIQTPRLLYVNLADVPVSLDLFNDFFRKHFIDNKMGNVPLHRFLKLLLEELINPVLNNRCRTHKSSRSHTTGTQLIFHTGKPGASAIDKQTGRIMIEGNDYKKYFLRNATQKGPITKKNRKDYVIISGRDGGIVSLSGDAEKDAKLGIMHYGLARDRGLLKSCSFKKMDIPYAREAIMTGAIADQDMTNTSKIWAVFNADVQLFGNPNIKPHEMVYIDPSMPGMGFLTNKGSAASVMRLGGYYRVLSVSNTITMSTWETQMECQW